VSDPKLVCQSCGMWTSAGREDLARRAREHPIYGTDFRGPQGAASQRPRDGAADRVREIESGVSPVPAREVLWR